MSAAAQPITAISRLGTGENLEQRVLILAPIGRDAELIKSVLRKQSIASERCCDVHDLTSRFEEGAGAIILTEESLLDVEVDISAMLSRQEQWSDVPLLLLTRMGADSSIVQGAVGAFRNITLYERPIRIAALVSAVRGALRARNRQYQIRVHLKEREEANRRKDEFLATLAHELRNPLGPIRNSVELLRHAPDRVHVIDMMERQFNHIVRLVDDLMEMSRLTRGKIDLVTTPVDLDKIISSSIETIQPLLSRGKHMLRRKAPAEKIVIDGDHIRLAQVFSNLLNNATKFSDAGSAISIEAGIRNEMAVVTVADTGIGISRDDLENIFEMFRQGKSPKGRMNSGLGIGLSLSRTLVEMHGGTLVATSDGEGLGSRFIVRLPIVSHPTAKVDDARQRIFELPTTQRIVVVDDNEDAAESLGELLRLLGATVRVAFDGDAALDLVESFRPNVIFLDLGMPRMDGYEVARRILQQEQHQSIALFALTGWGQEADRVRTQHAGFIHHFVKPVDLDEIREVLLPLAQ